LKWLTNIIQESNYLFFHLLKTKTMDQINLKISEVLTALDNGMTRDDIQEKYNLSTRQLKSIFQHPKLKGKKTKSIQVLVNLVDDLEVETVQQISEPNYQII
jgi:hypothetical protein